MFKYVTDVLEGFAGLVDKAVPFFVGSRTKIAVVACPVLGYVSHVLPTLAAPLAAIPGAGPVVAGVQVAVPYLQAFLCGSSVAFATAGLFRKQA